jgi:hypothetical protein
MREYSPPRMAKRGTDVQTEGLLGAWSIRKCFAATGDEGTWLFYLRKLYHRLLKALPERMVLSQVERSRLLGVKKGENFASAATHRGGGATMLSHFDP